MSRALPDRAIAIGAGLLFLGFAVWTWRSADDEPDADDAAAAGPGCSAWRSRSSWPSSGDKTMLTTAGLAADRGAVPVWIGSFAAMMAATALAVLAGSGAHPAGAARRCSAASARPPSRSSASLTLATA